MKFQFLFKLSLFILFFSITHTMETSLGKRKNELMPAIAAKYSKSQAHQSDPSALPLEVRMHIATFLTESETISIAIKNLKSFLLVCKDQSLFLSDELFTKNILAQLQTNFHQPIIEITQKMRSTASRKIAIDLTTQEQVVWDQFQSQMNQDYEYDHANLYDCYLFKTVQDKSLIPSYLYLATKRNLDYVRHINRTVDEDNYVAFQAWIDAGIVADHSLAQDIDVDYLWSCAIYEGSENIIRCFIKNNFNLNKLSADSTTLLDYISDQISEKMLERKHNIEKELQILYRFLRILIQAGAKSYCELNI